MKTEFKNTGSLSGSNHQQYVDVASFIQKQHYSKDNIEDADKMKSMEERVQTMVSNPNDQLKVMQMTSEMLGADKTYELRRKEGRTRIGRPQAQPTNNPPTNTPPSGGNGGNSPSPTTSNGGQGSNRGRNGNPTNSGSGNSRGGRPRGSGNSRRGRPRGSRNSRGTPSNNN